MTAKSKDSEASRARVARNMRRFRNSLGVSQRALAEAAGLHRTYIGAIELAQRNLSIDNLDRLAIALGVDSADFLAK